MKKICFSQEDFLKWKGSLFYRFVMAVVDENAEIRQFGECDVISF